MIAIMNHKAPIADARPQAEHESKDHGATGQSNDRKFSGFVGVAGDASASTTLKEHAHLPKFFKISIVPVSSVTSPFSIWNLSQDTEQ